MFGIVYAEISSRMKIFSSIKKMVDYVFNIEFLVNVKTLVHFNFWNLGL